MVVERHKCCPFADSYLFFEELFEILVRYFAVLDDSLDGDPGDHKLGLGKLSLPPSILHLDVRSVLRNGWWNQAVTRPHINAVLEVGLDLLMICSTLNRMVWWGPWLLFCTFLRVIVPTPLESTSTYLEEMTREDINNDAIS